MASQSTLHAQLSRSLRPLAACSGWSFRGVDMGQRILTISGELFPQLFLGEKHYRVIRDALPDDTKIVNVKLNFMSEERPQDVSFLLESKEWESVPDGQRIPDIEPTFQSLYPKEESYVTFAET